MIKSVLSKFISIPFGKQNSAVPYQAGTAPVCFKYNHQLRSVQNYQTCTKQSK